MNLTQFLQSQIAWSLKTFGPGRRTEGLCKHITKELDEIRAKPGDVKEWIDVAILALDGAWRCLVYRGNSTVYAVSESVGRVYVAELVDDALLSKQLENQFAREWPAPGPENEPTEHVR